MSKLEKFLEKLFKKPPSKNIRYEEAVRYLLSIGCSKPKNRGTSHNTFIHPDYPQYVVGLVANKNLKKYQIDEIIKLTIACGIYEEE